MVVAAQDDGMAAGEKPQGLKALGVPLRLAEDPEAGDALLGHLPPEDLGAPARETAYRLFGRDHNPALYLRSGLFEQGLLAIHRDFCLRVHGGCENCPLAAHLAP